MSQKMKESSTNITKEQFLSMPIQEAIDECEQKESQRYATVFDLRAKKAKEDSDLVGSTAFSLLAKISSFHLRSSDPKEPFEPMLVMGDTRTAIVDDIGGGELGLLDQVANEIADPELRARMADVLWIAKSDFKAACLAVDSYIESARNLEDPRRWSTSFERTERAFRIALKLGRKSDQPKKVVEHIEEILKRLDGKDPLFFSERLMGLLLEVSKGDPKIYCKLSRKQAETAETEKDWRRARHYWEVCAGWHRLDNDERGEKDALNRAAETYLQDANTAGPDGQKSSLRAAMLLQGAVEAHRRLGNTGRAKEIYKMLLAEQKESIKELKLISVPIDDLQEEAEKWAKEVEGKDFHSATMTLAAMFRSPKFDRLREYSIELTKEHPIQFLFHNVYLDEAGKFVGYMPDLFSGDDEEKKAAIQSVMVQNAGHHHTINIHGIFMPALHVINREHNYSTVDILPFLRTHPLVPAGREMLYAQGIVEGLRLNLDVSLHILIPQLENSIRHNLQQRDITTSYMDERGLQAEKPLSALLGLQETRDFFGVDLVFDLQTLVGDRAGANLRNLMAHGLMSHEAFFSQQAAYLFWLILHLIFIPFIQQAQAEAGNKEQDSEGGMKKDEDA